MDHDQNFKNLIIDYPHEALTFFAAEEAADIDHTVRIVPVRQEQLKERLSDHFHELDIPLLVEWPDQRREVLLFVVEEQTRGREFSIHRLAHYCLDLAQMFDTQRVVPVVIFLHAGKAPTRLELGGDRHTYLSFHYLRCVLGSLPYERYRDSDNIVARLNLPNMRYDPADKLEVYAHAVRGVLALEPSPERRLKYLDFVDMYAALDDNEFEQYQRRYPEEAQTVKTTISRLTAQAFDEGKEEGIQEGEKKGQKKGESLMLQRQLQLKFGPLAEGALQRIEAADVEVLLAWADRVLTADSLDEVLH